MTKVSPTSKATQLSIEVSEAEGISKAIFVKQRSLDPITGALRDEFRAVCSYGQLEQFDEYAPRDGSSYFRDYMITLVSEHPSYLETLLSDILVQTQQLVDNVIAAERLTTENLIIISR